MSATFLPVDPVKLHAAWPFIRTGLDAVRGKAKHTRWWPEDVYAAIQSRAATCYIVDVAGVWRGFFVVHPSQVPFAGETELFVWIVWSQPLAAWPDPHQRLLVNMETFRFWARLALEAGHTAVSTLTVRKGLLRRYGEWWHSDTIPVRMEQETLLRLSREVM